MDKPVQADPNTDWEALLNLREWLSKALEQAGARRTGGGVGCGGADLEIELEGFKYDVSITPRLAKQARPAKDTGNE